MPSKITQKAFGLAVAAACGAAALVGAPGTAAAQAKDVSVSPMGKGTVGGALLGGEVVCLTMAAIGVEKGWPYWVFGGVGAVGGGIGGFVVDKTLQDNKSSAEPSLYMLAGGMVLLIPTIVASLNATSYHPPETDQKEPVKNEPAAEPPRAAPPGPEPAPGGAAPPAPGTRAPTRASGQRVATRHQQHVPIGVLDMYKGHLGLGVPAPEVRPLYSQREVALYGVQQGTEVKFPVLRATF